MSEDTDGGIRVVPTALTDPVATLLIDELSDVLDAAYGSSGRDGFKPAEEDGALFVVAYEGDRPVGCGALRAMPDQQNIGEVKRMYSRPGTSGVGRTVLAALEAHAREQGYVSIWLETRRANTRGVYFYEMAGYRERAAYGKYVGRPEAICMDKEL